MVAVTTAEETILKSLPINEGLINVVNICQEGYYPCTCETYPFDQIPSLYVNFKDVPSFVLPLTKPFVYSSIPFDVLCPNFELLPNTTATKTLAIESCPLFNEWDNVARQNRLTSLSLISLDNILEGLILTFNGLTQVPSQTQLFSQRQNVTLSDNNISTAGNGSLAFSTPKLKRLFLNRNGLSHFEPEAFQGDFSVCEVLLGYNDLTKLESTVFKSVLEQMDATDVGYFSVENNPFECDCDLAWIFRDNLKRSNQKWKMHQRKLLFIARPDRFRLL
ncbi:hypothetical protein DAPPUDRAFT_318463 [Daphnia pulex]|uniref:LRRCT domain-containing protein n=1 Tax=Daphnia pulex TaxID=6669 RepID=E9GIX5_DAPPU|nr:hypothetical protein DAPPUDRAFT_318463 [Daphnia pulex]|eukprot:EFX80577.1 hypothetical protein DAPPUDRAFT_318463 [Daphnia pulex]